MTALTRHPTVLAKARQGKAGPHLAGPTGAWLAKAGPLFVGPGRAWLGKAGPHLAGLGEAGWRGVCEGVEG
jgi:hypothetical protein